MDDPGAVIAKRVRRQRDGCADLGSPLYAGLLERLATDVEAAGPGLRALEPFADWPGESAYVLRLMGAVNRLVLTGEAPGLAPHFRPGGEAEAAWPPFRRLLDERGDDLKTLALAHPVQTNEVGRCAVLAPAILWLSHGMPVRLLELGASAGLNLRWDAYRYEDAWGNPASPVHLVERYEGTQPPFEPPRVVIIERRGCDARPVDPSTDDGRLTLLSYVWPDQGERLALLRGALTVAREQPAPVDRAPAGEWLQRALAEPPRPGIVTVVFQSIFWQYLGDEERRKVSATIADAGAHATADAPLAWLRMEADGELTRVDATLWPGSGSRLIARAGYHGRPVHWLTGDDEEGAGG